MTVIDQFSTQRVTSAPNSAKVSLYVGLSGTAFAAFLDATPTSLAKTPGVARMAYVDLPFYFAIAAIGLGLSLMSYRLFARHYAWPMGAWHENHPTLPFVIGLASLSVGALFTAARWADGGIYAASSIGMFGLALAILWTAFLRVGSQISLILAPVFAGLLFVSWNFGTSALQYHTVRSEIRELRQQLEDQYGLKRKDGAPPRTGTQN